MQKKNDRKYLASVTLYNIPYMETPRKTQVIKKAQDVSVTFFHADGYCCHLMLSTENALKVDKFVR